MTYVLRHGSPKKKRQKTFEFWIANNYTKLLEKGKDKTYLFWYTLMFLDILWYPQALHDSSCFLKCRVVLLSVIIAKSTEANSNTNQALNIFLI
jgi:hypothetical protein